MTFSEFEEMQKIVKDLRETEVGKQFQDIYFHNGFYLVLLNTTWNKLLAEHGIKRFDIEVHSDGFRSRIETETQMDYLHSGYTILLLSCKTPLEFAREAFYYLKDRPELTDEH